MSCPSMNTTGSPTKRNSENAISPTASITSTACARRRRRKASMGNYNLTMSKFAGTLIAWHPLHGRQALPWQGTRDPYRIWLSEIMLQQTQVAAVVPYYERFLRRFPDVGSLADASEEEVLELWSGLGYYARGRNLLHAAQEIE